MSAPALLARAFFSRRADEVAPDLLGCVLEHEDDEGLVAVEVTEVEAYLGEADPASHAWRGKTPRNAVMYGPPGHAYVYFTYGMHFCVNLVCLPEGTASAVLVRAGRIVSGEELARARRARPPGSARDLARGPARLCQALAIDRALNGADACDPASPLRIRGGRGLAGSTIRRGPRTGVSRGADTEWRYWLDADPTVSAYRAHVPRSRLAVGWPRAEEVSAYVESGTILAARYRLDKLLGGGGMGEVWQGHDLRLDREVAVKVMREGVDLDPTARRRFHKEATIPARLQHPGITVVYDADQHEGRGRHRGKLFIVTELLHGESLEHHLAAHPGPLPVSQAIGFAIQLADALAWAHENGVVHRDLKPSNIFIDAHARIKVCDFGIAAQMDAQSRVTQAGWTVGTPAYMAPEQWEGNPAAPSMDLYALGCILYLMLAGRLPFDGQSPPVLMRQHFHHRPVPARDRNPQVPADLNDLLLGLLAKDPHDRPANARAVLAALTRIRAVAEPAPVPPVPPPPAFAPPSAPVRRAALVACASSGQESFDVIAVDRAGRVQGRMDFADGGGGNWGSGQWVTWFAASELPGRITAVAEGLSHDGHWAIAAVADGVPYLKLNAQEPYRLCDPASAAPSLPVLDVAVLYGSGPPEVFALDAARNVWHLSWPASGWTLWDDALVPAPATMIAMASRDHQAFAATAGTRILIKSRTPYGSWSRWEGKDLGRRLLDIACLVSERHFALFALDEAGTIWHGVHPLGLPASNDGTSLGSWGAVAPPPGGVTGIAATALEAQRAAADRGGLLVAMTSDGAIHSAQYTLGAGSQPQWSGWRQMPALE